MQQIFLNSATQKIRGDDTEFTLDPQVNASGLKLVLNKLVLTNFASNFGIGYTDFSYYTGGIFVRFTVSQIHLTVQQFFQYFNANNIPQLSAPNSDTTFNKLVIISTQPFSPVGQGWLKLGFVATQLDTGLLAPQLQSVNQNPATYFNLTQTKVWYVKFKNMINAYEGFDGGASFMIPNNSTFGQNLIYDATQVDLNQQILFPLEYTFRELEIVLEDENHQKIQTNNNNQSGMNVWMSMSLYQYQPQN